MKVQLRKTHNNEFIIPQTTSKVLSRSKFENKLFIERLKIFNKDKSVENLFQSHNKKQKQSKRKMSVEKQEGFNNSRYPSLEQLRQKPIETI